MELRKETFVPPQAASGSEGSEWAEAFFARARRAALRARMRAVPDGVPVRLVACALFVGALGGIVRWAAGLLSGL